MIDVDIPEVAKMRQKAEELLKSKSSLINANHSEADVSKLIHELEVHQIELEMQNEELLLANEAKNVANEKYIEIYDFAPSGYFTLTSNGKIIELNLTGATMLGKERLYLKNKLLAVFISDSTKLIFSDFVKNVFKGSDKESCEVIFQTDNKLPLFVLITGIISKNRKQCFITAIDITKRRQAELLIQRQNQELKELYATKDKLFSIIAHDLRSPFNSILGYSELLIENAKSNHDDETATFSEIINTSANNTLHLLDNLLNWAKSQTGQISFNPEKINLSDLINEMIEILNPTAKFKNISVKFLPSNEIEVYADNNMLLTILRNLIHNAIKFTNLNGEIEINARQQKDIIHITVSDNGVGMDQATMDKLFSPDTSTTPGTAKEHGSGLGLLICKEFVEKHGGTIGVESEAGNGSIFHFTIPGK